jgi:hypothetical protein
MSSPVFSRTDTITDSEKFYNTILDLLDDPDEKKEVDDLITWWNRFVHNNLYNLLIYNNHSHSRVFPASSARPMVALNSALGKIREKRAALKAMQRS